MRLQTRTGSLREGLRRGSESYNDSGVCFLSSTFPVSLFLLRTLANRGGEFCTSEIE